VSLELVSVQLVQSQMNGIKGCKPRRLQTGACLPCENLANGGDRRVLTGENKRYDSRNKARDRPVSVAERQVGIYPLHGPSEGSGNIGSTIAPVLLFPVLRGASGNDVPEVNGHISDPYLAGRYFWR
jgi:hypothetical protein